MREATASRGLPLLASAVSLALPKGHSLASSVSLRTAWAHSLQMATAPGPSPFPLSTSMATSFLFLPQKLQVSIEVPPVYSYTGSTLKVPEHLDSSLSPGTTYYYRVVALNFSGKESAASEVISVTT